MPDTKTTEELQALFEKPPAQTQTCRKCNSPVEIMAVRTPDKCNAFHFQAVFNPGKSDGIKFCTNVAYVRSDLCYYHRKLKKENLEPGKNDSMPTMPENGTHRNVSSFAVRTLHSPRRTP